MILDLLENPVDSSVPTSPIPPAFNNPFVITIDPVVLSRREKGCD